LGRTPTSIEFAISSRAEAEAYLKHPILGPRLKECTQMVLLIDAKSINQIFSYPDDLKFLSSMTLFADVAADKNIFQDALRKYFGSKVDRFTLEHLAAT